MIKLDLSVKSSVATCPASLVFPVFVARSASYMGAISTATGVLFAVGWDAEPVNVDLTIPPPDPPLDRGEASA